MQEVWRPASHRGWRARGGEGRGGRQAFLLICPGVGRPRGVLLLGPARPTDRPGRPAWRALPSLTSPLVPPSPRMHAKPLSRPDRVAANHLGCFESRIADLKSLEVFLTRNYPPTSVASRSRMLCCRKNCNVDSGYCPGNEKLEESDYDSHAMN